MEKFTRSQDGVEVKFEYCWETILHGSLAFLNIYERNTDFPLIRLSFQGSLYRKQRWKIRYCLLPEQRVGLLTVLEIVCPSKAMNRRTIYLVQ